MKTHITIKKCCISCIAALLVLFMFCTQPQAAWELMGSVPTTNQLRVVWCASGTDVFAAGDYGTIIQYNGTIWSTMTSGIVQNIFGVWGASGSDVFAVADSGKIIQYNGVAWTQMPSPVSTRLRDVWGFSGSDVFAVGESGKILHYNGSSWSTMSSPTSLTLQGVWGSSGTNVFAVGGPSASSPGVYGIILKYDGTNWTTTPTDPSIIRFHDAWGSSATNIFAVGEAGAIEHTTDGGTSWTLMDNPVKGSTVTLRDIWGDSANNIFAVGDGIGTDFGSTILHYDGSTWSIMDNPVSNTILKIHGVSGSPGDSVFAVGEAGTVLKYVPVIDSDGDGIPDAEDNCPAKPNGPNLGTCSSTSDKPGINCTSDADCVNGCSSNGKCSLSQDDTDGDGVGDVCDCAPLDNTKFKIWTVYVDADGDGHGAGTAVNVCGGATIPAGYSISNDDGCPNDPLKIAPGICGCGVPDTDSDGDGVLNCIDNCPTTPNGPLLGTCMPGSDKAGTTCHSDADCVNGCSSNGKCSLNQEDTNTDGKGDVCSP